MADNIHTPSRRSVLAGAFSLPLIGTFFATAAKAANRSKWDQALANYRHQRARMIAHQRDHFEPAYQRLLAALPPHSDGTLNTVDEQGRALWNELWKRHISSHKLDGIAIDDWSDIYGENVANAALELHSMPAPDAEALLWKLEELWADDPCASYNEETIERLLADARRLLGNGRG